MTDKDIVKALECCISDDDGTRERPCKGCPLLQNDSCSNSLRKYALDLIYRQKEEIEFLRKTIGKNSKKALDVTLEEIEKSRVEAIKEFAERLKQTITNEIITYYNSNGGGYYLAEDTIEDIDNLVKEMTDNTE